MKIQTFAIAALASVIGVSMMGSAALANPLPIKETTTKKCLILPEVNEGLIHNSKKGDKSALDKREDYRYEYAYKTQRRVKLTRFNERGKATSEDFTVVNNETQRFRGEEIGHVKNLAEKFVDARNFHRCNHK